MNPGPREFLVFVEEEDDGFETQDRIVLQVEPPQLRPTRELEVQPEIDLRIENTGSAWARVGLVLSVLGAILSVAGFAVFAVTYPQQWIASGGLLYQEPVLRLTAGLVSVGGVALVAGALLTFYGRRLEARAELVSLRVTESAPSH